MANTVNQTMALREFTNQMGERPTIPKVGPRPKDKKLVPKWAAAKAQQKRAKAACAAWDSELRKFCPSLATGLENQVFRISKSGLTLEPCY